MNKLSVTAVVIILCAIIGVGLALRLINISSENFSLDEAFSVANARHPLKEITRVITNENYPPLYPYLLHGWLKVFGVSEASARSLSLLLGSVSVVVMYFLGREFLSRQGGIIAALLTSLSAFHLEFSQEARMYMLMFLLGALATLFLWRAIHSGRPRDYALYVVFTVLNFYAHFFTIFLLLGQLFFVIIYQQIKRGGEGSRQPYLVSFLAIIVLSAPWLPRLVERAVFLQKGFWLHQYPPNILKVWQNLPDFLFLHYQHWQNSSFLSQAPWLYYLLVAVLMILVLLPTRDKVGGYFKENGQKIVFLAVLFFIPLAAAYVTKTYVGRYMMIIVPIFYLWLAWGLARLRYFFLQALAVTAIIILMIPPWLEVTRTHYDWPSVGRAIQREEMAGDVVILYSPMHRYLLEYYYHGQLPTSGFFSLAAAGRRNDEAEIVKYSGFLMINKDTVGTELAYLTRSYQRVWLLSYQQPILDPDNLVQPWLGEHYQLSSSTPFPYRFQGEDLALLLFTGK